METNRYALSVSHVTHEQLIQVIDTQPADPACRVVDVKKNREDAEMLVARLNTEFAMQLRKMRARGLVWMRAARCWDWIHV